MSGYKRVNYYELCRLCTATEGTKMHIFREEGRRRQLASKIPLCLPLQVVEDDSLPKIVCSTCVEKLESVYEFREACVNAEAMLESYFSTIRAEDHKEGQAAMVYVRENYPVKETSPSKIEVVTPSGKVPGPTFVLPVGGDGLSNLIQAAGIQILSDAESARLQPILSTSNAPILETGDGTRYAYLNNPVPAPEVSLEKVESKPEIVATDRSGESQQLPQNAPQMQPQTITFAGQEIMVHFNIKDTDPTNPQLQRASIAQLGEILKMNLVDGATVVKDPAVPGGLRIVGLPQNILTSQQLQDNRQHEQEQQIQQFLQTQSLQQREIEQQQEHHHQQQQLQQIQLHQKLDQIQLPQKKKKKRDTANYEAPQLQPHQQETHDQQIQQLQLQQIQLQQQQRQPQLQIDHKLHQLHQEFTSPILQFGNENEPEDDIHDDVRDDVSSQGDKDRHDSMCSSIEAVVSGAGGQDLDTKSLYSCDECPKLFKRKEHLFQHQRLHSGERPYICQFCDKTFVRKEHLLRHSVSHSGEKQFPCEQCGKNFSRKDNLHKHRKTHATEGPYICQTCNKAFIVKHYYTMHMACHGIAVEGENGGIAMDPSHFPYKCDVCGKGFPTKAFCDSHRLRHRKVIRRSRSDKDDKSDSSDANVDERDEKNQNRCVKEEEEADPLRQLQVNGHQLPQGETHHSDMQQCQELGQILERNSIVPVTIQTSLPTNNAVNNLLPHIIQQIVPTSSQAVIQVQSSANGTTYICSPEILETYHRLQPS